MTWARSSCDAPGLTRIGDGDGVNNGPFDLSDDYVNRVYLAKPFWNTLDPAVQPVFPPLTPFVDIPERQLSPSPQAYECKTIIYSNDDPDPPRRRHRYIGRYAEMVGLVGGAVWTVNVFMWGSGLKRSITLDFSNLASYAAATQIGPAAAQFGALYLDYHIFTANHLDLPKLPASQIDGIAFGEPAPTVATIAALVSGRGQW